MVVKPAWRPESRSASPGFPLLPPRFPLRLKGLLGKSPGRDYRIGGRDDCSDGSGESPENGSSDDLRMVFGENGGSPSGIVPRVPSRVASGSAGWRRDKSRTCGRCANLAPSQPRRSGAQNRPRNKFPFPAESELPLPANLSRMFPRRTPVGWTSAVDVHSRPDARPALRS